MSKFGISKDLQAKAGIPISAPLPLDKPTPLFSKGYSFPLAVLESVTFVPEKKTEDRQTKEVTLQPVLEFVFRDNNNPEKKITSIRYAIDEDDDKFDVKHEGLTKSIKHIFEELVGEDKFNEDDFSAESHAELFEKTAIAFNKYTVKQTKKVKDAEDVIVEVPIYKTHVFYLKLVYFSSRLGLPMYPNFIQKAFKPTKDGLIQIPCELSKGQKDEFVDKSSASPASSNGSGRENSFGVPGGGSAFGMPMDMGNLPDMNFPGE